jgi:rhodanese-related sulfurtransferase
LNKFAPLYQNELNMYSIPQFQEFNLDGVSHVSVQECTELYKEGNVSFIDVRETDELLVATFGMEDVLHFPMSSIVDTYQIIPKDRKVIVACMHGIRSVKVINFLRIKGWTDVYNLDGGMIEWVKKGLPYKSIIQEHGSCQSGGCGCDCESCG